ncbi:tetratricopeptide repeat protein [Roseovarius arcticus]|uniref:tetratricopeptide repeat protein n=1 Tax=Roseovarius arcticus TaxID=2547404 RepID=UPI001110C346|nr:tetratricopeptide repeat protein [Roseovarius arcticus]
MMVRTGILSGARMFAAVLAALVLLTACDSAEERAEEHFQSGMAFVEAGDIDRALIEFRNVFKLNGNHKEARLTYARIERERGNIPASFGQFLRLIEQDPDNLEGRRALAEMALETGNWEELERHGAAAAELAPDDLEIQALNNSLAYSQSIKSGNIAASRLVVQKSRDLIQADPGLMNARRTLIDYLVRSRDWDDALDEIDAALALDPNTSGLYAVRLSILQELNRPSDVEAQLLQMTQLFPGDEGVKQLLMQHYIDHEDLDAAERFLRKEAATASEDFMPVQRLTVFLDQYRGSAVAISELDKVIAQGGPSTERMRAMRAVLKFRAGDTDTAITEMRALLKDAERSITTREIEVEFARLLFQAGKPDEARALVEAMLVEDPTQVDALKFKAAWLIEEDQTGDAIVLLRNALGQAPRDPQLMTLMAQAHERNGDRALMGEMLALAVEISLNAAPESLRYAQYLITEGNQTVAERVLIDALRLSPQNRELLAALGELYLQTQDWPRLDSVIRTISSLDDSNAVAMANQLKSKMLSAQERTGDLTEFLTQLADDPEFEVSAELALVRSELAQGEVKSALDRLDELLEASPDSLPLRFVKAHTMNIDGNPDEAETLYRAILGDHPDAVAVWAALRELKVEQGDMDAAQSVLDDALAKLPKDLNLLMMQASEYERTGQLDNAIDVYEKLYAIDSRALVVANNLASLLTTHRTDDESLERAYALARRLKNTRVAAYQDTYGWVAYRLGNYEDALRYLKSAADALPQEPLVFYHLAKTYVALERIDDALVAYQTALDVSGSAESPTKLTTELKSEIERLSAEPEVSQ